MAVSPATASHLTVQFGQDAVLRGVSFDVRPNSRTAIVGPNGAGKTTLLKTLLGLIEPTRGSVTLLGDTPKRTRHLVGYVPQRSAVQWDFPATALDVVLMGLYRSLPWWRPVRTAERERAMEALTTVDLADIAGKQIRTLSGGQQQRVMLARAIVQEPSVFFLDEPFTGIDAVSEHTIVHALAVRHKAGATIVQVHHNLQTLPRYFTDVVLLRGSVVAAGSVPETLTSEHLERTFGAQV